MTVLQFNFVQRDILHYLYHSVAYTVVRAIPQELRFSTIWDSETLEPIELKFGIVDYVRHYYSIKRCFEL